MNPLFIIGIVLAGLVVLFFVMYFANKSASKKIYPRRGDASNSIKYPLPSDFNNLDIKKDYFVNNKNARLTVYTYVKKNTSPKAVVLVSHGIGGGHFYLLPLINYLCLRDLAVVAYDQYGSMTSEGRRIESMNQGAIDVKFALRYVEDHFKLPIYTLGHSWGGYCAAQTLRYSSKVEKCAIIAGLNNEASMVNVPSIFRPLAKLIVMLCGATLYGKYSFYSTYGAMKKTSAKVLYLQGKDDPVVLPKYTGYKYQKKFKNKKNIKVVMLDKKGHSPIVTYESQLRQAEVMKQFGILGGNLVDLDTYIDFNKNNIPDKDVYNLIGDFLVD